MLKAGSFVLLFACGNNDNGPEDGLIDGMPAPDQPSDGTCPDMRQSGTVSFSSSGTDRTVSVVVPDGLREDMPLVYFFHGLLSPQSTPRPTEYMVNALRLQDLANEEGVVLVLPQSNVMERLGMEFFMWDIETEESDDMVLFDDLRACAYGILNIDLTRVHAMGFSGGALFSTVVGTARSHVLASMIQMSGGSDIEMMTFDQPLSAYLPFEYTLPSLLITGGRGDAWPGGGVTLVDFSSATDNLESQLTEDGHFVVRCEHDFGQTVPVSASQVAREWIRDHRHGETSPYVSVELSSLQSFAGWCLSVNE